MASIPVYLLSISGKISVLYLTYKAIEKLTRELWSSSSVSVDTGAPGASAVPAVFPARVLAAVENREEVDENERSTSPGSSQEKEIVSQDSQLLEFNFLDLPIRPGEEVCWDYMHDGNCKDGHSCRFDHPNPIAVVGGDIPSGSVQLHLPNASQLASTSGSFPLNDTIPDQDAANPPVPVVMLPPQGILASNGDQVNEESEKGVPSGKKGQQECKYYLQPGGCKLGKACSFSHSRRKPKVPPPLPTRPLDFNFLDLPIRPDERECSYYMRDGVCKDGRNCRFHHPDPVAVEGHIPSASFLFPPSGILEPTSTSLSFPSNGDVPYLEAANPYVTSMVLPHQWVPDPEWNEYEATSSHEWTQPLLIPNPGHAGWSWPKTPPAMDDNCRKDAKKTKILQFPYCHICKAYYSSKDKLAQHKLEKKHKQKMEALKKSKKETSAPADSAAPVVKDPMIGPRESPEIGEDNTVRQSAGCEIHNIDCRSKDVADQHKMEKKLKNLETVEQTKKEAKILQPPYCRVCKIHCSSKDNLTEHKLGKNHKEKMEALKKSKKESSAPAASAAPVVKDSMIGPRESPEIGKDETVRQSVGCEIRNVDCRSKDVLDQHKMEKKHEKNLETVEQTKKEAKIQQSPYCHICKIHCSSKDNLAQHKLGKKHKEKMDALKKPMKEMSAPASSTAPVVKDLMIGRREIPEVGKGKTVRQSVGCEIRNVDCRSKDVSDQHKMEKKHEKNLDKMEQSNKEAKIVQSLCCDICKIHCSGEDNLAQHKLGKKHKEKMDALEKSKKETSTPAEKDYVIGSNPERNCYQTMAAWCSPQRGFLKMNSDFSFSEERGKGGIGFVLRDHCGVPIWAISEPCGCSWVLMGEALALRSGMTMVRDASMRSVVFECDSEMLVRFIHEPALVCTLEVAMFLVIEDLKVLLSGEPGWSVQLVSRSANVVADDLAKRAQSMASWTAWHISSPWLLELCNQDALSSSCPPLI